MADALFSSIERLHGSRLWGRFLDAGTGLHSLRWIQSLSTTNITAITADINMRNQILKDPRVVSKMREQDHILVGNWMDDSLCDSLGQYDTILADYLIGAVDGFSPYEQDTILLKLRRHLLPNGRMYFVGMNPIPDETLPPGNIISEIRRARDACILLAGHRPYREYPVTWMKRHLERGGMEIVQVKSYTILHSEESALRQIRVARSKLDYMMNTSLKKGMENYLLDLEFRMREVMNSNGGKIPLSYDYILAVEHLSMDNVQNAEMMQAVGIPLYQFYNMLNLNKPLHPNSLATNSLDSSSLPTPPTSSAGWQRPPFPTTRVQLPDQSSSFSNNQSTPPSKRELDEDDKVDGC